jgi:hypothetical protein
MSRVYVTQRGILARCEELRKIAHGGSSLPRPLAHLDTCSLTPLCGRVADFLTVEVLSLAGVVHVVRYHGLFVIDVWPGRPGQVGEPSVGRYGRKLSSNLPVEWRRGRASRYGPDTAAVIA